MPDLARGGVTMPTTEAILLPGGVLPADLAYGALLAELGPDVDARTKDLEVYADDGPPPDFSLQVEVDGVARFADAAGFERFHLLGYSAGGAVALAFTAAHPGRVRSLALLEPAWAGWTGLTPEEAAMWDRFREVVELPDPDERMRAFVRMELAPGVPPPAPAPGPSPPWMAKRPAGLHAFSRAFDAADLDLDALRAFERPVLFVLGGLSHPDLYARIRDRLAAVFPDFRVELYADRHHFDPPHRIEPARVARSLRALWLEAAARA
jgi:pimeloyl-ACP methyl ester carboxylesterase